MTRTIDVDLIADVRAALGESPVWDADNERLVWVDIIPGVVHQLDITSGDDRQIEVGPTVGAAALRHDGGFVLARNDGFTLLDADGTVSAVAGAPGVVPGQRMNDGKCDPSGRFWAGSIVMDKGSAAGALYRLDADLGVRTMQDGVTVSNGLGWSPDGTTMYYVDSLAGGVDAFAFDTASGTISDRRQFIDIPFEHGEPDGLTVDAAGCLWFAIWRAGEVRRYMPDGRLDTIVRVPATLSTSCCFGGRGLDTLFVTSAHCDLTPEQHAEQPHAGSIFACRPGVDGMPATPFAGPR
jgi:sugar lactone lactonase YvrE